MPSKILALTGVTRFSCAMEAMHSHYCWCLKQAKFFPIFQWLVL